MARMRTTLVAATATVAALAAPTTASAVTTDCDGLQAALNNTANSVVTLAEGESCNNHFTLPSRSITLEGGGAGATLSGISKGNFQILSGHDTASTTIRNLTFVEGFSQDNGGAIRLTGDNAVTIEDNTFIGNHAEDNGGAVSIDAEDPGPEDDVRTRGDATPVIFSGNTFGGSDEGDDNTADEDGGAVYVNVPFRPLLLHEGNQFVDNRAGGSGGGLSVEDSSDFILIDNFFGGNQANEDGGGAAVDVCFTAEVTDNIFSANRVLNEGGSLEGGGLALYRQGCVEKAARGGSGEPDLLQSGNLFQNNEIDGASSGWGGGEYVEGFQASSTNDSYVGNTVDGGRQAFGGGLGYFGYGGQALTARNLVAAGNAAAGNQPPPSRGVANTGAGGGLFLAGFQGSAFQVEDSTVEGNTAAQGSGIAGGLFQAGKTARGEFQDAVLVLQNSIVFGNEGASDSSENSADGEIAGFDRDVSFSDVCNDGEAHDGAGNICADPKLSGDNTDGNVNQTPASPTINKGDNSLVDGDLTKDYVGDARVIGGKVDMGADEYKPATVTPPAEKPPVAQSPAAAPPAGEVQGVQQKSCTSRRAFRIRIRVPKGKKARSAVVRVNGKKVKVVRGKRLRAPVRLKGLPKGKFKVRITIRLTNGKKVSGVRTYHTCIPKLPGDGPPKV